MYEDLRPVFLDCKKWFCIFGCKFSALWIQFFALCCWWNVGLMIFFPFWMQFFAFCKYCTPRILLPRKTTFLFPHISFISDLYYKDSLHKAWFFKTSYITVILAKYHIKRNPEKGWLDVLFPSQKSRIKNIENENRILIHFQFSCQILIHTSTKRVYSSM